MSQLLLLLNATEKVLIEMRDNVSSMINFAHLDLMVKLVGDSGHVVKLTAGRAVEWLDLQRKDFLNAIIDCQRARFPLNLVLLPIYLLHLRYLLTMIYGALTAKLLLR